MGAHVNIAGYDFILEGLGDVPMPYMPFVVSDQREGKISEFAIQGDFLLEKEETWLDFNRKVLPLGCSLIHASAVVKDGTAILFLGESGTGKSTQARLWCENIPDTFLLNDDCPAIRLPYVYGTPWSGKTPCYKNEHYPIRAIVRLSQAKQNQIERLTVLRSIGALQPSFSPQLANEDSNMDHIMSLISDIIESIPVYHLACLPNRQAVLLCYQTLFEQHL